MSKLVAFALVALAALSMVTGAPIFPRQNPHGGRDSSVHWGPSHSIDLQNANPSSPPGPANTLTPDSSSPPASEPSSVPHPVDLYEDGDEMDDDCDHDPSSSSVDEPSSTSPPDSNSDPTSTPAPAPTPVPHPSSTTEGPAPSSTSTPDQGSPSNPETHTGGDLTWFEQGGVAGACGQVHSDNDLIAALDSSIYGDSGAQSPYCGKNIRVTWGGNSVIVAVADDCPTCSNPSSVDLSKAAFEALAPLDKGLLSDATWTLL